MQVYTLITMVLSVMATLSILYGIKMYIMGVYSLMKVVRTYVLIGSVWYTLGYVGSAYLQEDGPSTYLVLVLASLILYFFIDPKRSNKGDVIVEEPERESKEKVDSSKFKKLEEVDINKRTPEAVRTKIRRLETKDLYYKQSGTDTRSVRDNEENQV